MPGLQPNTILHYAVDVDSLSLISSYCGSGVIKNVF